jgi:hypothetical protein
MMRLLQLVTLLAGIQAAPVVPQETGTVRVRVTVADTQTPLAGARVTLTTVAAGGTTVQAQPVSFSPVTLVTDANGEAVFAKVPLGSYRATASRDGFVGTVPANGSTSLPQLATAYTEVKAVSSTQSIAVSMNPASSISGRVTDSSGTPVVSAAVSVLIAGSENGEPALRPGPSARTDSRGNYRFTSLGPGEYYVRVQLFPASTDSLYPDTNDLAEARRVPVRGGQDIVGIDIRIPAAPVR